MTFDTVCPYQGLDIFPIRAGVTVGERPAGLQELILLLVVEPARGGLGDRLSGGGGQGGVGGKDHLVRAWP